MTEKGADCWDIITSVVLPIHEHGASGWCWQKEKLTDCFEM
jgi:hypothetical protein